MGFSLASLFGARAPQTRPPSTVLPPVTRAEPEAPTAIRKEVLRLALRESLSRNGIPPHWITADTLLSKGRTGRAGIHVRLSVRHWDPRLAVCLPAFQEHLERRVHGMDPMAAEWLTGISWIYALSPDAAFPPLPEPATWRERAQTHPGAATAMPAETPPGQGDVIVGPAAIATPSAPAQDARANLDRLFAEADAARDAGAERAFASTEPAGLR